jgi:hypothetical protein
VSRGINGGFHSSQRTAGGLEISLCWQKENWQQSHCIVAFSNRENQEKDKQTARKMQINLFLQVSLEGEKP